MKPYLFVITIMLGVFSCTVKTKTAEPEEKGLTCIGNSYFPKVDSTHELTFPNGSFEKIRNDWPIDGWATPNGENIAKTVAALTELNQRIPKPAEIAEAMNITLGEYDFIFSRIKESQISSAWGSVASATAHIQLITNNKAPEGKTYLHITGNKASLLRSPDFELKSNQPHLLSLWVRSNEVADGGPWFWYDIGLDKIKVDLKGLPDTKGEWKRVGIYFRVPVNVTRGHWTMHFNSKDSSYLDIDDVQLRTATEQEFSEGYAAWRKKMPSNEIISNSTDGKYLASTIAKLEGKMGIAGKPFLIYGVGSSFTNYLGDLETWRQVIRERFPNAPEIVYKSRVGSGCPYDYARGWVHTGVLAEQPDLVFSYTNGDIEALEAMLKDIRLHSTADIIIPSLHFYENSKLIPEEINEPEWDKIRELCEKYNAQFVDNRRELAAWLIKNNQPVTYLLFDACHENDLGKLLISENISAHFVKNTNPAYSPDGLEKEWFVSEAYKARDKNFTFSDGWEIKDKMLVSNKSGANIKLGFNGNRIDLIGLKTSNGGNIRVIIDGKPAGQAPAFFTSFVEPAYTNISHNGDYPRSSEGNHDTGPHGVNLAKNITPQNWTIRMTDNAGNYELEGKVTGFDGKGNNRKMFVSKSGQIVIDPAVWRHPQANVIGDFWTFNVYRCASDTVNFKSKTDKPEFFSIPLVQNLSNGQHTLEVIIDGEVAIKSFYVFTPMLKE